MTCSSFWRVSGRGRLLMSRGKSARFPRECKMQNAKCRIWQRLLFAFCILHFAFALISCQRVGPGFQKMARQPRYDPLEPSDFFTDGMASRPRVPGTVARGELVTNPFLATGKIGAADGDGFPFPITEEVLNRGHERFNISCPESPGR